VVDQRPLVIVFDQPMDAASVQSHVTLSPTMNVEASWPDNSTLHLQPQAPWPSEVPFELTVAEGARSATGGVLTEPFRLRFAAGGRGVRLPILMYHHVLDLPDDASEGQRTWTVSPAAFAEQMRYLVDHEWVTVGPSGLAAYLAEGAPLPPRSFMLTMDDGYREVYTTALPLLRNTPLRPVLFIIPETMGYGAYLNWEQLGELAATGFWVGCHSYDHTSLRGLSAEELAWQLGDSRALLEERLGLTIDAFCYPFGSYDDDTLAALSGYGYRTAFTLNPTSYQDPLAPLQLGRRRIDYATTLEDFIALVEP
jgi:peptidoglycan/xylan/chitin deacetylase (PgdA/CDA1 family)